MSRSARAILLSILVLVVGLPTASGPVAAVTAAARSSDFNGDGIADLAIGVPGEAIGAVEAAGLVNVLYGSSAGITSKNDQAWSKATDGISDLESPLRAGARFGQALASGDFDRDGYADLAIGAGDLWPDPSLAQGSVTVLYGTASGLSAVGAQLFHPLDLPGTEAGDRTASALASGDFDGDGYLDLAVGARADTGLGPGNRAGVVTILRGSADGLTSTGAIVLPWLSDGTPGGYDAEDRNGWPIAIGDLDGDGYDDLVVGLSGEPVGGAQGAGAVDVWYGGPDGPIPGTADRWSQASTGIADSPEAGDRFGSVLAVGDVNGDGYDDAAIGVPAECLAGIACEHGAVHVILGSAAGLTASGSLFLHEDTSGVPGVRETGDRFGSALALGDTNGDGYDDLAIGVRKEDVGSIRDAGAVVVLRGSASGLSTSGARVWTQNSSGVPSPAETGDRFGTALLMRDFGRSGHVDLVVGVPFENVGAVVDAGLVNVIYGSSRGLTGTGAQAWTQDSTGIAGTSERVDYFGETLAQ